MHPYTNRIPIAGAAGQSARIATCAAPMGTARNTCARKLTAINHKLFAPIPDDMCVCVCLCRTFTCAPPTGIATTQAPATFDADRSVEMPCGRRQRCLCCSPQLHLMSACLRSVDAVRRVRAHVCVCVGITFGQPSVRAAPRGHNSKRTEKKNQQQQKRAQLVRL